MHTDANAASAARSGAALEEALGATTQRLPDLLSVTQWSAVVDSFGLSARQAQVLRLAFYDERDGVIAVRLRLSLHTVHTQRIRLFRKLGVVSMPQAIAPAATRSVEILLAGRTRLANCEIGLDGGVSQIPFADLALSPKPVSPK